MERGKKIEGRRNKSTSTSGAQAQSPRGQGGTQLELTKFMKRRRDAKGTDFLAGEGASNTNSTSIGDNKSWGSSISEEVINTLTARAELGLWLEKTNK